MILPRDWMPESLQSVSLVTPHAGALIAYSELLENSIPDFAIVMQLDSLIALPGEPAVAAHVGELILWRVVAAGVEWVTSGDSVHSLPASADRTVFLDRLNEIVAASGVKATPLAENGTEEKLIDFDEPYQDQRGKLNDPA